MRAPALNAEHHNTKHGNARRGSPRPRIYRVWANMRARCNCQGCPEFKNYGGRGIAVCQEWATFSVFREWAMSHGYGPTLDIDRINNDGNYEPSNCRFVDRATNCRNKRNNRVIELLGERKTVVEWSEDPRCSVKPYAIYQRLNKGWDALRAVTQPPMKSGVLGLAIVLLLAIGTLAAQAQQPQQTGPQGWAGEDVAAQARRDLGKDAPPELLIVGGDRADTANQYIPLWQFTKSVNGRKHLDNTAQEVGDCVAHGTANACRYSFAVQLFLGQADGKFRLAYPPYIYGTSRVQIGGGKIRGDGSVGAWAAKAIEQYGVLAQDEPGVPAYSGSIARDWGKHGPPPNFVALAKPFTAETRRITDWDDACQALANGWPIAVCSSAGFGRIVEANNRIEGRWSTSWAHCMCFVALDTRAGREALYCLNSWGPSAHAKASRYAELDGAPPGGFWVLKADAEKMLKQGDSHAVSFNGFKPRPKSVYETLQKPGAN